MSLYFVTGAAGFIGSTVCRLLLDQGHEVAGVDNLEASLYDPRMKDWRLGELSGREGFTFHRLDVTSPLPVFLDLLAGRKVEAVLNLAARAGVRPSIEAPWSYYEANVLGTLRMLELCRDAGIPRLVVASSSSLYGHSPERPFREDQATDRPISPYAASKKAAEELAHAYHHLYGTSVVALRYFTVYGPAARPDMAPFRFVQRIVEGKPLFVTGDGSQERDFTFVEDVAAATVAATALDGYHVINVGSDHPVPLRALITGIEERCGKKAVIEYRPKHPADVDATWACVERARKLLGWEPRTSLASGIGAMVDWYLANRSWAREIATE